MMASPTHGNLAVALLSRSGSEDLASSLQTSSGSPHLKAFATDTSPTQLKSAFESIRTWSESLGNPNLKLKIAVWNIKHSHRVDFASETPEAFGESIQTYVTGAMVFAQLSTKWMLEQYPTSPEAVMHKRGTLIFTGTLGALRTNPGYAAYGAGRSGVRMLAQSLAREYSAKGIHVVHAIANGGITDAYHDYGHGEMKQEDAEKVLKGAKMRAESIGRLYLTMMEQECDLWTHELDMRPAAEKF